MPVWPRENMPPSSGDASRGDVADKQPHKVSAVPKPNFVPKISGFERASFTNKAPRVKYVLPPRSGLSSDMSDFPNDSSPAPTQNNPPVSATLPSQSTTAASLPDGQKKQSQLGSGLGIAPPAGLGAFKKTSPDLRGSVQYAGNATSLTGQSPPSSFAIGKTAGTIVYNTSYGATSQCGGSNQMMNLYGTADQAAGSLTLQQQASADEDSLGYWFRRVFLGNCCEVDHASRAQPAVVVQHYPPRGTL
ncbi:unnamed protein product [Amoebophrya sp. A25]|nr:unnamed protein product [Amoebophrya sp. A25]|eukprot:GSA25T00005234001.1